MGQRIRQPDGTYCYTPGCRIHEGTALKEGADIVFQDMKGLLFKEQEKGVLELLKEQEQFLSSPAPDIQIYIRQIARQLSESLANNGVPSVADLNLRISRMFGWSDNDVTMDSSNWDRMSMLSLEIVSAVNDASALIPTDKVAFRKGGTGTVLKSNPLGGRVTVRRSDNKKTETVSSEEVIRLQSSTSTARTRIVALGPHDTVPGRTVMALLEEETNNHRRNHDPVAYRRIAPYNMPAVRQELTEAGERFNNALGDRNVSKDRIVRFLRDEHAKRRTWLETSDRQAVKIAFTNVLNYLTVTPVE